MKLLLFSTLGLFLFCSCISSIKEKRNSTGISGNQFWKKQKERKISFQSIAGKAFLRYTGKKESVSGKGSIHSRLPSFFRLELRDLLGRVQHLSILERQFFYAYYPSQKKVYRDQKQGTLYIQQFMGVPFSFSIVELQEIFLGILPDSIQFNHFDKWEWNSAKGVYIGVKEKSKRRLECHVHPEKIQLEGFSLVSEVEDLEVTYSDFGLCCGLQNPDFSHWIEIKSAKNGLSIGVEWDQIDVIAAKLGMEEPFSVPDGVRMIPIE